jgi:virginiamycin B lyase
VTTSPGNTSTIINCNTATKICSGSVLAPPGNDTFAVNLYDGTNGTGNLLSTGAVTQTIVAYQTNAVSVTFNGVVASLSVMLNPSSVTVGTAATVAVVANALDADGNTIIGPGVYVSSGGGALTVNLANSDTSGATQLSQSSLTQPTSNLSLSYNGANITGATITASGAGLGSASATLTASSSSSGTFSEFSTGISANAQLLNITAGSDNNLWFTENALRRIGKITTSGMVTEYSAGISGDDPLGDIVAGPDGNIWFTEYTYPGVNRIGKITTSGVVTEYSAGISPDSQIGGITAGPDGNLWFTEQVGNRIAKITTSGSVTEYSTGITAFAGPSAIARGSDGNLWFTEVNSSGNKIGRITTSGVVTEYSAGISSGAGLGPIAAGPDGNLWFTEFSINKIARITTSGIVTEFSNGISASVGPSVVAAGSDGNVWFTEGNSGGSLGRITPSGTVTEFPASTAYSGSSYVQLHGLVTGPDNALWYTEIRSNRIGRFILPQGGTATPTPGPIPTPTVTPTPSPSASPTPIPTLTPTPLPSGSPTPIATHTPSPSPTASPTATPSPTPSPAGTPPIPTNLTPGSSSGPGPTLSSNTVTLSWSASIGATTYEAAVRDVTTGSGGPIVADNTVGGTSTAVTLSSGRQYRWDVDACAGVNCSNYASPAYFQTPGSGQGFLAFPLACGDPNCSLLVYSQGAYTPSIMFTVLDHSLVQNPNGLWQYGTCTSGSYPNCTGGGDGRIIAFDGETASGPPSPNDRTCILGTLNVSGMVIPGGCGQGPNYASYDEHPGYDYYATLSTPVKAAASGVVVNNGSGSAADARCVPTNISSCSAFNYVGIDHGNGYISQYGHLSTVSVTPGQSVTQGQQIGLSGDTGVSGHPHLHFEVIKLIPGYSAQNYADPARYAVVDPYGWTGAGVDPLYSVGLGIPSVRLWQ